MKCPDDLKFIMTTWHFIPCSCGVSCTTNYPWPFRNHPSFRKHDFCSSDCCYLYSTWGQPDGMLLIRPILSLWVGGAGIWDYLKALLLCHAIRADSLLLINLQCSHTVNKQWVWQMADMFVCTFKSAQCSLFCWVFDFQALFRLSSIYIIISVLTHWWLITEFCTS